MNKIANGKASDADSSAGSVYQKNAAAFFGMDPPAQGERPFQKVAIKKPTPDEVKSSRGFSVLL